MAVIILLIGLLSGYLLNIIVNIISNSISEEESENKLNLSGEIKKSFKYNNINIKRHLLVRPGVESISVILINLLLLYISFWKFGINIIYLKSAVMTWVLIVTSFVDLRHQIIPDMIVAAAVVLGLLFSLAGTLTIADLFFGALTGGGILFILALVPGALGGGDIKLMFAIGGFLGPMKILWAVLIAFVIGSVISLALLITKVKGRKDHIPFGPFLAIGSIISFYALL